MSGIADFLSSPWQNLGPMSFEERDGLRFGWAELPSGAFTIAALGRWPNGAEYESAAVVNGEYVGVVQYQAIADGYRADLVVTGWVDGKPVVDVVVAVLDEAVKR